MRSSYPTIRHDTPHCVSPLAIRCRSPRCSLSPTARSLTHSSVGLLPRRGEAEREGSVLGDGNTHTHTQLGRLLSVTSYRITSHSNTSRCLSLASQTRSLVQPRRQGVRRRERRVSSDQILLLPSPVSLCVARVIPSVRGVDRVTNPKM